MTTIDDQDRISARDLIIPAMLCASTFFIALVLAISLGLSGTEILETYYRGSVYPAFIIVLLWSVLPHWRGREYRDLTPTNALRALLAKRWPLLIFPLLLTPVFNTGYTIAKTAFPFYVGFRWDEVWINLDRALFGIDPWRITHAVIGPEITNVLVWGYMLIWGLALVSVFPALLFFAHPATAIRAHVAFMLVWFFGGVVGATIFSSAGPAFASLSAPALGDHFSPLYDSLNHLLAEDNVILRSQAYLPQSYGTLEVVKGAGISAMPSMHLSTAALYVMMAWRTRFFLPAIVFWVVIWISSVHLGYHYAVDGIAGLGIAYAAWRITAPRRAAIVTAPSPQLALA